MKKIVFLFWLANVTALAQSGAPLTSATPESAGISPDRLKKIDEMLAKAVADNEVPGAVALIARKGKIVYLKAHGKAGPNTILKEDHIFRIASQTKAITSTAAMMLWEEGKFKLDDPVSKYIPEFKEMGILDTFNERDSSFTTTPATKSITIRQLLTHTSGLGYGMIDDSTFRKIYQKAGITDAFTTKPVSLKKNIEKLAKMPLHFNPGEKYQYSESIDVVGYLVEILSGKPLDVFFKERIFDPLTMSDTYFYLPDTKAKRLVSVLLKNDDQWPVFSDTTYFDPQYPVKGARQFFSGGAGLSSTAQDYAKFLQMYLNKGIYNGKRLLSRTTVDFMMGNHIGDLWAGGNEHLGLAFSVVNEKGQNTGGSGSQGTFSWGGYFNTQYFADPKEQLIGVILKQTVNANNDSTGWRFRQMAFQTIND